MAITQHTTLQWRCSSPTRTARPRSATPTSSTRTGSESTASGRRRINSTFSTPPTRSSLGANSTSKGGIRRHGYCDRERLVRYYIGALRCPGDRFEDKVCRARPAPKGRAGRLQRRSLSHLCSPYSWPIVPPLDSTAEGRTPFREPLRFIVMAVMSVMSGTFPDTYRVST
jgi:hypothetical protein